MRQAVSLVVAGTSIAIMRARKRLRLPPIVSTLCAFSPAIGIAAGFNRSKWRDTAIWGAHMWGYKNAFELPNDRSRQLRERAHLDYVILADRLVGRGAPPGQRLQRMLRQRGRLSVLDKTLTFFYWTWEAEPHLVLAWIRWQRPGSFAAAAGRLAATFDFTLLPYWLLPTAPPWWASEQAGRMGGDVRRVMSEVASWLKREPNPTEGNHELGANPFAAMPSDHFASAAMTAILLGEHDPRLGSIGWCYALALGFALVYLGEHYVTDLLAGLAYALLVNSYRESLESAAERLLRLAD